MKTIGQTITEQHEIARGRGWDRVYWAIDLHSTLIKPNYAAGAGGYISYYQGSTAVMRELTQRTDSTLIMYTCSWPKEIERYREVFKTDGIVFDHVNENPDVKQTGYGYYFDKPYFNIMLDDKAGFDPSTDWEDIRQTLNRLPLLGTK